MATIDDILTTQKNGVVAINNLSQTLSSFYDSYLSIIGTNTSNTIDSISTIFSGAGRLVGFTVINAGSGAGTLYDSTILSVIGASYTSTTVTLVYGSPSAKFAAGDTIIVSGMSPSGYNGSYTVTTIGTDPTTGAPDVTYANATNAPITVNGICFNGNLSRKRASVPNSAGFTASNIVIAEGLVYQPGSGQATNFTYSR